MSGRSRHVALLVGVALPAALTAQTLPREQAFGARESVTSASLSPGGTRFAFLAPAEGQGNALYTASVDGAAPPARGLVASGKPERLRYCGWVSESRWSATSTSCATAVWARWCSQLMDDALKDAGKPHQLITYDKLDHQLDDSAARADMLKRSDDFHQGGVREVTKKGGPRGTALFSFPEARRGKAASSDLA